MVQRLWVARGAHAVPPTIRIINFEERCAGVSGVALGDALDVFDDYTTNFEDLGYWDTRAVLQPQTGGVPIEDFMARLGAAIQRLGDDGFPPFDPPDDDEEWAWGHCRTKERDACTCTPPPTTSWRAVDCALPRCPRIWLPRATRCAILNYHLRCIYTELARFEDDVWVHLHDGAPG